MKTAILFLTLAIAGLHNSSGQTGEIACVRTGGPGTLVGTIIEDVPGDYILLRSPMGQVTRIRYSEIESIVYKSKLQDQLPESETRRSPLLAGLLSAAIPGAGQVYNGDYGTAILYPLGIAGIGAVWFLTMYLDWASNPRMSITDDGPSPLATFIGLVCGIGTVAVYVLGIADAVESANMRNRRASYASSAPPAPSLPGASLTSISEGTSLTFHIPLPF